MLINDLTSYNVAVWCVPGRVAVVSVCRCSVHTLETVLNIFSTDIASKNFFGVPITARGDDKDVYTDFDI